ncbi:GMC oxidoreductase [Roseibium marinum]|uniref:Choline dehydrogenase-like flavoprotein n=1 Tax=Roseibium marinum TaxID=281252 RepID=A0A2S3UXD8_9HYPH|nr:GMC family oxidoreductase [Roseibium marinum]POF32388.1 choline dehydrogenase-like flavoprotein [Roseibium marinum]
MGYDIPHEKVAATTYDVIIVGSGFAGANMAYLLGSSPYNKKVLIIESGQGIQRSREDYMENFYLNTFKSPSSPYPPNNNATFMDVPPEQVNTPRATVQDLVNGWAVDTVGKYQNLPEKSYLTYTANSMPFASTYERVAGGTGNHWMGTCLRMSPEDLKIQTEYGVGRDWPIDYNDLTDFYNQAEGLIGVSADVSQQDTAVGSEWPDDSQFTSGYAYPMRPITPSHLDGMIADAVTGQTLTDDNPNTALVSQTPAGRNSEPYMNRRVCHGNTNCTPICPIQAKYDPQFTLSLAMDTGNVDMISQSVVDWIDVDADGNVNTIHYITYESNAVPATSGATGDYTLSIDASTSVVIAAHAIESAKILLNSSRVTGKPIANSSGLVGCNLMDHPTYLAWGLMAQGKPAYGYRGPLSTSGIENLRTGVFRSTRAPWRIEIGNEAWNWPTGDPYTSGMDYLYGINKAGTNTGPDTVMGNAQYLTRLNDILTRQFRVAFLVEQPASAQNRMVLSETYTDNLGIPRPELTYVLDDYTMAGFNEARLAATKLIETLLGGTEYTAFDNTSAAQFNYGGLDYNYQGAGHICGTHVMGTSPADSVVDSFQKSWDHNNLYLCGCGSMPSIGTENPTLTMLALACRSVTQIGTA